MKGDSGVRRIWRPLALAGLAIALAILAHINTLHHPFVWDDEHEVQANTSIETLSHPLAILRHNPARPIINLSYAIDYAIWGGRDEFGFHLTNLVLHLINVGLLFGFTRLVVQDLGRARGRPNEVAADATAFAASALLAVHPMMTEAVGYVSSRSELLCGAFLLISLLCFRKSFDAQVGPVSDAQYIFSPRANRWPNADGVGSRQDCCVSASRSGPKKSPQCSRSRWFCTMCCFAPTLCR